MRVAWPEKVICLLAIGAGLVLICFGSLLNARSVSYDWIDAAGEIEWHFMRVALLPAWLVLRTIDFLTGGPARRG
jgi:hypothetical protein